MRALLVALLLLLAGCMGSQPGPSTSASPSDDLPLTAGTWPDGERARGFIESYVMTHPYRVEGSAFDAAGTMAQARDGLVAVLEGFGNLTVVRHSYEGGENILAFHNATGADADRVPWVVVSAHYDSASAQTVYGAWDDGAGVAALLELARATADWQMPFHLVFAFFDGEEKGLVGSSRFVEHFVVDGGVEVLANLNTDPPGLNWPCGDAAGPFVVKVIHELDLVAADADPNATSDRHTWLYHAVDHALDQAAVPEGVRDMTPGIPVARVGSLGLRGTSDHASFGVAGVANVFLGGVPATKAALAQQEAAAALTYPLHTPLDTLQAMDARCAAGGPDSSLAGGLQTILDLFAHSLSWMAQHPAPSA